MNAERNQAGVADARPHTTGEDLSIVLDAQALARLRELDPDGRHHVLQRVLSTYETSLGKLLTQLVDARGRGDAAGVGAVAHTLKSSSASVGAMALADRCRGLERAVRDGQGVDLAAQTEVLLLEGERTRSAVRAMLQA